MIVLRSMLFVPGNSMRMIAKATTLASDAIILDLEDAVSLPDKATARAMTRDSIKAVKSRGAYVFVRVNALTTKVTAEDLKSVVVEGLDGIMLAKTETKSDMVELDGMIEEAERGSGLELGSLRIIPLIETAKGVMNAYEIASASERVVAVAFGAGDYYRDLGRSVSFLSPEQTELLYARSQIVNGSRAAGIQAIDTVFFGVLTDREGFMKETILALQLGFKGKLIIHPSQIEVANKIFSPSLDEAEYARRVVEAFEEAQVRGLGAISFEGKMIDYMSYKQAKDLVSFVEFIAEKEGNRQRAPSVSLSQFFA
ncbi:MAG: Citrate lyase subunit beta [Syntrophomonadaceae bacterium]|nr:Citrate lyase subunit beta [Bacillota bacterium]MBT9146710.1 Citrate lyase subunit beta [Bacillota bacterium]